MSAENLKVRCRFRQVMISKLHLHNDILHRSRHQFLPFSVIKSLFRTRNVVWCLKQPRRNVFGSSAFALSKDRQQQPPNQVIRHRRWTLPYIFTSLGTTHSVESARFRGKTTVKATRRHIPLPIDCFCTQPLRA